MAAEEPVDVELMLYRFNRLIKEMIRGVLARNSFQSWEIDILVDLEDCTLEKRRKLEILRQYQRAVEHQLATGPGPPMKLSTFLAIREERRKGAGGATPEPISDA